MLTSGNSVASSLTAWATPVVCSSNLNINWSLLKHAVILKTENLQQLVNTPHLCTYICYNTWCKVSYLSVVDFWASNKAYIFLVIFFTHAFSSSFCGSSPVQWKITRCLMLFTYVPLLSLHLRSNSAFFWRSYSFLAMSTRAYGSTRFGLVTWLLFVLGLVGGKLLFSDGLILRSDDTSSCWIMWLVTGGH